MGQCNAIFCAVWTGDTRDTRPDSDIRLGSLSASPKLIPEEGSAPGFDIV
jgi:hypothetical protein